MATPKELNFGKLTKKFLMGLPAGVYLISSVGDSPTERCFAEYVEDLSLREVQWKRITASQADQRQCSVFNDKKDAEEWMAQVEKSTY